MERASVALYSDVFIRPTELAFNCTSGDLFSPLEILILNKAKRCLRFKILSTTRASYCLSKCKGILKLGEFVKIQIEPRAPLPKKCRKDFFKIQFFDSIDDTFQGERYLSAYLWTGSSETTFQTLDSDSCNSWPSGAEEPLPLSPASRAVSLARALDKLPLPGCDEGVYSGQLHALSSGHLNFFHRVRPLSAVRRKQDGAVVNAGATSEPQSSLRDLCDDLSSCLRSLIFTFIFLFCVVGICLPLVISRPLVLIEWIYSRGASSLGTQPLSDHECSDEILGSTSTDGACVSHNSRSSEDEFFRHRRLAIHYLKASIQSVLGAICSINPLNAVTNLSWFCLGLSLMFYFVRH